MAQGKINLRTWFSALGLRGSRYCGCGNCHMKLIKVTQIKAKQMLRVMMPKKPRASTRKLQLIKT